MMNPDPHSEAGKEEPNKQPKSQNISIIQDQKNQDQGRWIFALDFD
jgi:hypothetical protein